MLDVVVNDGMPPKEPGKQFLGWSPDGRAWMVRYNPRMDHFCAVRFRDDWPDNFSHSVLIDGVANSIARWAYIDGAV